MNLLSYKRQVILKQHSQYSGLSLIEISGNAKRSLVREVEMWNKNG